MLGAEAKPLSHSHTTTVYGYSRERASHIFEAVVIEAFTDFDAYNYRIPLSNTRFPCLSNILPRFRPLLRNPTLRPASSLEPVHLVTHLAPASSPQTSLTCPSSHRCLRALLRAVPSRRILEALLLAHGAHAPRVLMYDVPLPGAGFFPVHLAAC